MTQEGKVSSDSDCNLAVSEESRNIEEKNLAEKCDGEGNLSVVLPNSSSGVNLIEAKVQKSHCRPGVSAARLPLKILNHIFQYLKLRDLRSVILTCQSWHNALSLEDSVIWQEHLIRKVPEAALSDPFLLGELGSAKKKLRAWHYSWNANDISRNNYIRTNGFTVHRQPVAQSTDGVRGKTAVFQGVHAFDITWDGPLGTVAVIGFATKHAALHCVGYIPLLGSDDQSWGWNLVDNMLMHNGQQLGVYPEMNNPPKYEMGERIRLVIDCDRHLAYFERGSEFLGVAFKQIPPLRLFPAVCAVYGNTEVSMIYVGSPPVG